MGYTGRQVIQTKLYVSYLFLQLETAVNVPSA